MSLILKSILILVLSVIFIIYAPVLLDFSPVEYELPAFENLGGPLKVNTRLNDGEKLLEGKIFGPKSFATHKGSIYTGTLDGCITRITAENKLTCVVKMDKYCTAQKGFGSKECGRPLGLRIDQDGVLYAADAFKGIFMADVKKGSIIPLLTTEDIVGNRRITFPNDLDIDENDMIYFTDSSTKWPSNYALFSILEHENSGRVIQYDTVLNRATVLLDNLYLPTGIQLSKKRDYLLISEHSKNRIIRYYLKGSKKGQSEVLVELPGGPENIRPSKKGYWIALTGYMNISNPTSIYRMHDLPIGRKLIVRFQHTIGCLLNYICKYWYSPQLKDMADYLEEGHMWLNAITDYGLVVEINEEGKIIQSFHSPDGRNIFLSEILEHNGHLYIGSILNPYIIRIKQT